MHHQSKGRAYRTSKRDKTALGKMGIMRYAFMVMLHLSLFMVRMGLFSDVWAQRALQQQVVMRVHFFTVLHIHHDDILTLVFQGLDVRPAFVLPFRSHQRQGNHCLHHFGCCWYRPRQYFYHFEAWKYYL